MKAQIPEKPTTYDPVNHIMRTTIKETLIHDTTINNLRGRDKAPIPLSDCAKKTVRQTLPLQDTTRNIGNTTYKVTFYNTDSPKLTIRNTTKCNPTSETGFISGDTTEGIGAYSVIDVEMKNTQKQFISDHEHIGTGTSMSDHRQMSDEQYENAEIDPSREMMNLETSHIPNAGGGYTGLGVDKVDMEVKKLTSDYINNRENNNITRVNNVINPIGLEQITKPADRLNNVTNDRLDNNILSSLRENPYNISVNPI
jgi:hypothetical protein